MNEKNLLMAMMGGVSAFFIMLIVAMFGWRKSRPAITEAIYQKCDYFVKLKAYRYLLVATYFLPMITPAPLMWIRFFLMSLFFVLLLPLGIKVVIGKAIKKNADAKQAVKSIVK